jgi:Ca-activated chloride channel homolog
MITKITPILLIALLGLTCDVTAQKKAKATAPEVTRQDEDREVVNIRRVLLPISVLDKKGQPVAGLLQNDFLILEDKKPQQIETFSSEKQSPPLYIGILIDTSGSTAGKMRFEKEAAKNFIYTVARPRIDRLALISFDDEVRLLQDFTDKVDLIDKALDKITKPGSHTSLYDAIWKFCDEKMRSVPGRRALVVVTDGDDTYSRATLKEAIDIAQRTETTIFAVSTKAGFAGVVPGVEAGMVNDSGDSQIEKLCDETGGKALFTGDLLALERSFTRIAKELHSQYVITYRPDNNRYDGSYRKIEVKLAKGSKGHRVRTKRGYTAVSDQIAR